MPCKFESLEGRNIIKLHKKIAARFVDNFKKEGVIGIVLLGGIARGYADKYSDIDIIVFTERNVDLGIPRESEISVKVPEEDYKKYGINVVTIDYEIIEYDKASEEK
ncbi:MAG: nucleotidyltransferase domain-containing protein [Candidatus Njordarchaeia archaeon]